MDVLHAIALSLGAAWASGINLYAVVLVLGGLQATGLATLPPGMDVLSHPLVLGVAAVLFLLEFFADKIPGLDSAWDGIHTFIRIPAGIVLAAQAVAHIDPAVMVAAGLVGGGLAAGSHATKAGTRLIANTSPEPISNWTLSVSEDALVVAGLWGALNYPVLFFGFLALMIAAMAYVLPKLFGTITRALRWALSWRKKPAAT